MIMYIDKPLLKISTCFILLYVIGCQSIAMKQPKMHTRPIHSHIAKARIVIDPGHGGSDSGAVGKRGLLEKDVTLDIAKRMKHLFNKYLPQVEVMLTRSADRFVSLEDRIIMAHQKKSDVFLSLHVNSSESKDANGFEIYSLDVASDRHAERLAARENKSASQRNPQVDFILADLRAFSNRRDSDRLALGIAQGIKSQLSKNKSIGKVHDRGYHQAIFHVLFVKMPAVLAELFFISNPEDEKMLSQRAFRELIARGLFLGVKNYLDKNSLRAENVSP